MLIMILLISVAVFSVPAFACAVCLENVSNLTAIFALFGLIAGIVSLFLLQNGIEAATREESAAAAGYASICCLLGVMVAIFGVSILGVNYLFPDLFSNVSKTGLTLFFIALGSAVYWIVVGFFVAVQANTSYELCRVERSPYESCGIKG